jgi:outer membrane lipoprotein SlyB
MAALSGAAAGAAVGGITGALVGLGIPEIEAKRYEGKIKGGNILIAVHVESSEQKDAAERVLKQSGAQDVSSTSEASVPKKEAPREVPSQRHPRS